jgi:hypothetical protein
MCQKKGAPKRDMGRTPTKRKPQKQRDRSKVIEKKDHNASAPIEAAY